MSKFIVGREKGGKTHFVKAVAKYGSGVVEAWTADEKEAARLTEEQADAVMTRLHRDRKSCDAGFVRTEAGKTVGGFAHPEAVTDVYQPEQTGVDSVPLVSPAELEQRHAVETELRELLGVDPNTMLGTTALLATAVQEIKDLRELANAPSTPAPPAA